MCVCVCARCCEIGWQAVTVDDTKKAIVFDADDFFALIDIDVVYTNGYQY